MPMLWIWVVLWSTVLATLSCGAGKTQCLVDYISMIRPLGLDEEYVEALGEISFKSEIASNFDMKVVLDIGLGSIYHYDVFRHLVQLNVTGYDLELKSSSFRCNYGSLIQDKMTSIVDEMVRNDDSHAYLYALGNLPSADSWYHVVANYPKAKVLRYDISDEEYFNNRNAGSCNREWSRHLQRHCYIPLMPVHRHGFNPFIEKHLISQFTFDQLKIMFAAYRSFIKCIVPAENLFQFDLNKTSPLEYWTRLTEFLNISLPAATSVKYLSEGGTVCDSVNQHSDARHLKRVKCADEYSTSIGTIYGERYRKFVRNLLLNPIYAPRRAPENSDRLVLNLGAGTTGTRTIQFSVARLNTTTLHYQNLFVMPEFKEKVDMNDFDYDMRVLEKVRADQRVFWGDIPVPNRWWYLYWMYPKTHFIFTDVRNATVWAVQRRKHLCTFDPHCNRLFIRDPLYTAPVPFWHNKSPLSRLFFQLAQINIASFDTIHQTFEAYRRLVRCIIPENRIWWLYLPEMTNRTEEYWNRLFALTNVTLTAEQKLNYIRRGIPRSGTADVVWGGKGCKGPDDCYRFDHFSL